MNWNDYIVYFDMIVEFNYWNDEIKVLELVMSLWGLVLSVLSDLRLEYWYSFCYFVFVLLVRFELEN